VRGDQQAQLQPLVVSWGWEKTPPGPSRFHDIFDWIGTADPSASLSVPAAISYQQEHRWHEVRARCHQLACEANSAIAAVTGLGTICPDAWLGQMCAIPLPACDSAAVKARLYDTYHIEVPIIDWNESQFVRISIQAYNSPADVQRLIDVLGEIF
jgi:isopenicillin-N epimerase